MIQATPTKNSARTHLSQHGVPWHSASMDTMTPSTYLSFVGSGDETEAIASTETAAKAVCPHSDASGECLPFDAAWFHMVAAHCFAILTVLLLFGQ